MRAKPSLRLKIAIGFSLFTIALLVANALGIRMLVQQEEERFLGQVISADMANVIEEYRQEPQKLPAWDRQLKGYVTHYGAKRISLPEYVRDLGYGIHEIALAGRELHVAIEPYDGARFYRLYDFSLYERRLRHFVGLMLLGTGLLVLLTLALAFALSGLLVRQVSNLAAKVRHVHQGNAPGEITGNYDEAEVVELARAFNNYHGQMAALVKREQEFTSDVSHELRTPLTSIKTSCELLVADPGLSAKSRKRLEGIARAADRMVEVIDALLTLAREGIGRVEGELRVADCIEEVVEPFRDVLSAKNVAIEVHAGQEVLRNVSRDALMLVLTNLVKNAVSYTDQGRIVIRHEGDVLRVEDTGVGMAGGDLTHAFDRFFRGKANGAARHGVGLGLAIVKRVCEQHGWTISLQSTEGRGTRVAIGFPAAT